MRILTKNPRAVACLEEIRDMGNPRNSVIPAEAGIQYHEKQETDHVTIFLKYDIMFPMVVNNN
jgi:hypothetical protein